MDIYIDLVLSYVNDQDLNGVLRVEASGIDKLFPFNTHTKAANVITAAKFFLYSKQDTTRKCLMDMASTMRVVISQFNPPPIQYCVCWDVNGKNRNLTVDRFNRTNTIQVFIVDKDFVPPENEDLNFLYVNVLDSPFEEINKRIIEFEEINKVAVNEIRIDLPFRPIRYDFIYTLSKTCKVVICLGSRTLAHLFLKQKNIVYEYPKIRKSMYTEIEGSYIICKMTKTTTLRHLKDIEKYANKKSYFSCLSVYYPKWQVINNPENSNEVILVSGPGSNLYISTRIR